MSCCEMRECDSVSVMGVRLLAPSRHGGNVDHLSQYLPALLYTSNEQLSPIMKENRAAQNRKLPILTSHKRRRTDITWMVGIRRRSVIDSNKRFAHQIGPQTGDKSLGECDCKLQSHSA